MARAPRLKVFRMPVGFHDAYVAAPSQKAAIEAWGADADVFRRGTAEEVTDPELAKEALASPGTVIKRLRGTAEEQIAALGKTELPAGAAKVDTKATPTKPRPKPKSKPKPRPSRAALDKAETALAEAEARQAEALKAIAAREAALAREREALETKLAAERSRLEARRDKVEAAYRQAMRRWRAG